MGNQKKKSEPERKRGRPAGTNRAPLSEEERRARNAQYERERRNENAAAMYDLAIAAGCAPNLSNAHILATVVGLLQAAAKQPSDDLQVLRQRNQNIISQIHTVKQRLADDHNVNIESSSSSESDEECDVRTHSNNKERKRLKLETQEEIWTQPQSTPAQTMPVSQLNLQWESELHDMDCDRVRLFSSNEPTWPEVEVKLEVGPQYMMK